jgi:pectate lyase
MAEKPPRAQFARILGASHLALLAIVACSSAIGAVPAAAQHAPIGWAAIPGHGIPTTTGGAGGDVVVARTADELLNYAKSDAPLIIRVEGTINGADLLTITSNKSIVGAGEGATIKGFELSLTGVSNVILRNLHITESRDGIALRRSHHVWIDHVAVSKCGDGAIDVTHQSDNVTISWCHLFEHDKTMLINSGANQPRDADTLNTTVHHTWFNGSIQRNPRVGYGKVHIFDALYDGQMSYGIGMHSQARVRLEQSYFDRTHNPIQQMYRDSPKSEHHGFVEAIGTIFNETTGKRNDEDISFPVDDYYLYDFALDPAAEAPSVVGAGAGPHEGFGSIVPLPTPGNGTVDVNPQLTLQWTKGESATAYEIALGTSDPLPNVATVTELTYAPQKLEPGTVYSWRVDQLTPTGKLAGETWHFKTASAASERNAPSPASAETR